MAFVEQSPQSSQLTKQRKGYIAISTTEWTTTSEDLICAGSSFEMADTVYYLSGDEDIDSTGTLAGLGNNTIVYVYASPATLQFYCSGTAPAWDDAKQGYYLGASPTHRCVFRFYKVSAGNYNKKCILDSRPAIYLKQYDHELDAYAYSTAGTSVLWTNTTNNLVSGTVNTTKIFFIKKPITFVYRSTKVSGDTVVSTNSYINLYSAGKGGYTIMGEVGGVFYDNIRSYKLNPGKYKAVFVHITAGGNNQGVRTCTIYVSGMYGGTSITKAACIDT